MNIVILICFSYFSSFTGIHNQFISKNNGNYEQVLYHELGYHIMLLDVYLTLQRHRTLAFCMLPDPRHKWLVLIQKPGG